MKYHISMAAMKQKFEQDGYLVVNDLISIQTIFRVRDYLKKHLASAQAELQRIGIDLAAPQVAEQIRATMSAPRSRDIDRELRSVATGHYPLRVRLNDTLWAVAREPTVQELLRCILGSDALGMHMPPMVRFVLPGNTEAGVPAHQDVAYNPHMANFVTLWVPLVEIDQDCGGVTVFPGSDKKVIPAEFMDHGIWLEGVDTTGWDAIDCIPMSPGDALLFNPMLVHRSMPNRSDHVRYSLDCRFFGDQRTSKHYLDMNRWEVIAP